MANFSPNELIKTVSKLSWSGFFKVIVFIAIAGVYGMEWLEDGEDGAQQELSRDLSVFTITTIEALRGTIEATEQRQDDKIDELEDDLEALQ